MDEIKVEVTALPPESAPPESAPPLPEVVVLENTTVIEQTPEGNTQWQERIETTLRTAAENQQNQTTQVIQTIQGFRETLDRTLNCMLAMEQKLSLLSPPESQSQPSQALPEPAPIAEPETAVPAEKKEKENQPSTQKKRLRI